MPGSGLFLRHVRDFRIGWSRTAADLTFPSAANKLL
jgi:hypothetical protein